MKFPKCEVMCRIRAFGAALLTLVVALVDVSCGLDLALSKKTHDAIAVVAGTYHLQNVCDATNLVIHEEGTFSWDAYVCDSGYGGGGIVRVINERTYFAGDSSEYFNFPNPSQEEGEVASRVQLIEVIRLADGGLRTKASDVVVDWAPGRVCSVCGIRSDEGSYGLTACDCVPGIVYAPVVPRCPDRGLPEETPSPVPPCVRGP